MLSAVSMPSTISQTNISNKTQTNICITHNYDNEQHVSVGLNKVIKLYPIPYNTHTQPFNGPLSGTTRVSWYQKGKTNLDFTEARDSEWQWHQLGHTQVSTSLQTDISGSGISWAICKSALHPRQTTMPAPHH